MTEKINGPVVEVAPGVFKRKPWSELRGEDLIAFGGGPETADEASRMQREFEAEIEAAGGLEAWRALPTKQAA